MFAVRSTSRLLSLNRVNLVRHISQTRINYNVVQDLYLRELKNVKLNPITAKDAEGNVKQWVDPAKPKKPELEGQGADALKAYSEETVETKTGVVEEDSVVEEDWLVLDDVEEDSHGH
ncbi:hypothetical protein HG537_0G03910 [Torulaspora globosa]|uniref:ATP synthase subunit H, mitochondrial n=1 Tax=Torulaspora globosa TaxID=48254 RepID=A0A7H9HZY3_9SACH|nr:hypothetical protein HG537_0G03910 [Torulaspora sp. CBS 2947]